MSAIEAIRRYDQFLMGNKKFTLKGPYDIEMSRPEDEEAVNDELDMFRLKSRKKKLAEQTARTKEEDALAVIRYMVIGILRWTPEDAMEHITPEIGAMLQIERVAKYVVYPPDVNRTDDRKEGYPWLINRAFPDDTKYDMRTRLLAIYEKVNRGELKQFPRYLFRGDDYEKKLSILLMDYISRNIPAYDIEDVYRIFADPVSGNRILKKANLFYAYRDFYDTPLSYLHSALGSESDDFYFNYYLFTDAVKDVERIEAEEKRKNKKHKTAQKQR